MLLKKMLNDLKQNIVQFLAIFVMAFISVFAAAGLGVISYEGINEYMVYSNFKDLDLEGVNFTVNDVGNIEMLDEVKKVNGIYNTNGKILLDKEEKILISYISGNEVSSMYLYEGEPYREGMPGAWIENTFAKEMGLSVGDTITVRSEDTLFTEEIMGLVASPQYLWYIVDSTYNEPAYEEYGFLIMDVGEYKKGPLLFNKIIVDTKDISGGLKPTKSDRKILEKVSRKIRDIIDDEKLVINDRTQDYQLHTYSNDVESFTAMLYVFPTLFAAVALLGILTTMTRLIKRQRTTIGALKALGFTSKTIISHYMSYSLFIIAVGCITGAIVGYTLLGTMMHEMMLEYYLHPFETMHVSLAIFISVFLLMVGSAAVSYFSNSKILKLSASQILQPEAPPPSKKSFFEGLELWKKLKFATQWNVRDVSRNVFRTVMSIFGVAISSALTFASFGFFETMKNQPGWKYGHLIVAETKIEFEGNTKYGTVYDYCEEYKGQMVQFSDIRIDFGDKSENTGLFVVDRGNKYFIDDEDGKYTDLPNGGIALSLRMAEKIGAKVGDYVEFSIKGEKTVYRDRIVLINRTPVSQGITLTRERFENLRGTFSPNVVYTNFDVDKAIEDRGEIISVTPTADLYRSIESLNKTYYAVVIMIIVLSILIGTVILYNLGSMSYNEKTKDMATLKVLGFLSKDLKTILMQQNIFITLIGFIVGLPIGFEVIGILATSFGEDVDCLIRLSAMPYILDFIMTFGLSVLINRFIASKLNELDMVLALKEV